MSGWLSIQIETLGVIQALRRQADPNSQWIAELMAELSFEQKGTEATEG